MQTQLGQKSTARSKLPSGGVLKEPRLVEYSSRYGLKRRCLLLLLVPCQHCGAVVGGDPAPSRVLCDSRSDRSFVVYTLRSFLLSISAGRGGSGAACRGFVRWQPDCRGSTIGSVRICYTLSVAVAVTLMWNHSDAAVPPGPRSSLASLATQRRSEQRFNGCWSECRWRSPSLCSRVQDCCATFTLWTRFSGSCERVRTRITGSWAGNGSLAHLSALKRSGMNARQLSFPFRSSTFDRL